MIVFFGRAEYKDKVPDVSDCHENIGTLRNSKLNLRIESIVKLVKGELMSTTAIPELSNFSGRF